MNMVDKKLGVDIGGVIIPSMGHGEDTSFGGENYLQTPPVADAITALSELNKRFGGQIYLVSKCGIKTENKTRNWLDHHNFYKKTEILPENVYFCRERRDKATICERLEISHFIDDRLEVLSYLVTVSHKYLFNPNEEEIEGNKEFLSSVVRVDSWKELLRGINKEGLASGS